MDGPHRTIRGRGSPTAVLLRLMQSVWLVKELFAKSATAWLDDSTPDEDDAVPSSSWSASLFCVSGAPWTQNRRILFAYNFRLQYLFAYCRRFFSPTIGFENNPIVALAFL